MQPEEFIPFEQALELNKLGCDISGSDFIYFHSWGNVAKSNQKYMYIGNLYNAYEDFYDETPWVLKQNKHGNFEDHFISAPLYQQAFRWFRNEHKLTACIVEEYNYTPITCKFQILNLSVNMEQRKYHNKNFFIESDIHSIYETYEEAELACIKKLIEIVKNKK